MVNSEIVFRKYHIHTQFDMVKDIWTSMLKKCPHIYYLTWTWRELWIKSLPQDIDLQLVAGFRNNQPVIAFFVGTRTKIRHKFFKIRELSINETGDPYYDLLWIEYNSILIDPEITITFKYLLDSMPIRWDELTVTRCAPSYQPNLQLNETASKNYILDIEDMRSYYVNLDKVRSNNNDYLAQISPKKRYQIRRSLKEYEKMGQIQITVAENIEGALQIFNELIQLHQKKWTELGEPGSFSNEYFDNFHKNVITERFKFGEIQLMKVSAGDHTLGCLYGLVYNGVVIGTLCGFNYLPKHLYSPGLICHYFAVMHNAKLGLNCYDFLEGGDHYKRSLSTDYNEMQNIFVRKKSMKYRAEEIMLKLYRLYRR